MNKLNVEWLLVKVTETSVQNSDSICFVIVAKSTQDKCLYYDWMGRVHDKTYDPSDGRCFWTLQKTLSLKDILRRLCQVFFCCFSHKAGNVEESN